jgi:hypothetical protein
MRWIIASSFLSRLLFGCLFRLPHTPVYYWCVISRIHNSLNDEVMKKIYKGMKEDEKMMMEWRKKIKK